jgi:hypothetical protein
MTLIFIPSLLVSDWQWGRGQPSRTASTELIQSNPGQVRATHSTLRHLSEHSRVSRATQLCCSCRLQPLVFINQFVVVPQVVWMTDTVGFHFIFTDTCINLSLLRPNVFLWIFFKEMRSICAEMAIYTHYNQIKSKRIWQRTKNLLGNF